MNQKKIHQLKILYLLVLVATLLLVGPTHLFSPPSFMPLRFAHYLEMMGPFLGVSWPMSFDVYHWILIILGIIGSLNILGITFPKWRKAARTSSFLGLFFFGAITLFFLFPFMQTNSQTAFIYASYSFFLLIVDLLTFRFLGAEKWN